MHTYLILDAGSAPISTFRFTCKKFYTFNTISYFKYKGHIVVKKLFNCEKDYKIYLPIHVQYKSGKKEKTGKTCKS